MSAKGEEHPYHAPNQRRFKKGNPGGPGNPHNKKLQQFRSALMKAVSSEDLQEIIQKMAKKAKGGDVAAAKFLFDRLLGKPVETVNQTSLNANIPAGDIDIRPLSSRQKAKLFEILAPAVKGEAVEIEEPEEQEPEDEPEPDQEKPKKKKMSRTNKKKEQEPEQKSIYSISSTQPIELHPEKEKK